MTRSRRSLMLALLLLGGLAVFARAGRAQGPAILINEILVGNTGTTLDADYTNYSGWIELRNTTGSNINLKNYRVTFLPDGSTTILNATIKGNLNLPGNGRVILWADEKNKGAHLAFQLDMDGGQLTLRNAGGGLIDQVTFGAQSPDVSYGRTPDGGGAWAFYDQPTFAGANTSAGFANNNPSSFATRPQFSVPGGPHNGSVNVTLSSPDAGATIRYTTDGSRPKGTSTLYTGPINVISSTVLRARAWVPGKMISPTATQTYLLNIPTNLPVISVVTDPPNLWDNYMGIYVRGSNGLTDCRGKANWHQKWERPASIEYYETNGTPRVNQEVGLEISGNCTRNFPQKSLEIKAKKIYGDNDMDYAFFPGDKPMTSYSRLILRNGGNDNYHAFLRDSFAQSLAMGRMDLDRQAYRPAVVYLNGQYWGLYEMREKMDEDYVENNYNLDEDEFDFLEKNFRVMNGSDDAFREFYNFIKSANVTQPAVYAQVQQRMDVSEFMNYLIVETFSANTDWGRNNVRYWNDYGPAYRWRWALHDLDFSFFVKNANKDMFAYGFKAGNPMGFIAKKLWDNVEYRNEFAQRYAAHLNTTFSAARINSLLDTMAAGIRPEMAAQTARWGKPPTVAAWEGEVQEVRTVALQRVTNSRAHLRKRLGNNPDSTLTIDIVGDGRVLVAGVEVADGYSGPHFRDIPINFSAIPGQGDDFSHWEVVGPGQTYNAADLSLPFDGDLTLRAVFDEEPPPPPPPPLVINELHHTPVDDNAYEFLEIYNPGTSAVNLSGFTIAGVTFTVPAGSAIAPGEYIVVADTPANYTGHGFQVFDFSGGLSDNGETITILDTFNQAADSVSYGTAAPWPANTIATDLSLSLLDPALDNSVAANWAASRDPGGTPGALNFPPLPPVPPVVINEIHYNPASGAAEFIELVNNGPDPVALDGFTFSGIDYTFPTGTELAAGAYLVIAAPGHSYPGALTWTSGDLDDDGETLALLDGDGQTVDTVTYDDEAPWPTTPDGSGPSLALGRVALDNSVATNWAASRDPGGTPGAVNFPPLPIVINELHHTSPAPLNDDTYEFLELYNAGSAAVDLSGYTFLNVTFTFPAGASIAAGEYIVVADTPATYSGHGYQVFDFSGGLSGSGELINLSDRFGNLVDSVDYKTVAPWPTTTATGPSLSLLDPLLDNSVAANWSPSRGDGGSPGAVNFPPLPPVPPLVINEIHYNPAGGAEFIELVNNGPDPVALDGFTFSDIDYTFPTGTELAAGGYLVIAAPGHSYPGALTWTSGDLDDDGETLSLLDGEGQTVDTVTYDDEAPWPTTPDGSGPSLALGRVALDNSVATNWAASRENGGTPGEVNFLPLALVINELQHTPVDDTYEFVEIYNTTAGPVDLSGYTIFGVTFTFPPGSSIDAGEYLIVADTAANYTGHGYQVFDFEGGLSSSGETVSLLDPFGNVADSVVYGTAAPWPANTTATDLSLSLLDPALDNAMAANWDASRQTGGTPGAVNFPPLPPVPPVVINEIHYNPVITPTVGIEFIELVNSGTAAVVLDDFTLSGIEYTFPTGTTLAAGEYLVIAADATGQPTWLQWANGENLDDDGETLSLRDAYDQTVDTVTYADSGAWPAEPDGSGPSLSLLAPTADNAAAANWAASDLVGGTPGAANFPGLPLVINEIHYNPVITPTVGIEFIELVNSGTATINLSGFTLSGIEYTFPAGTTLAGGDYLVIAANNSSQPDWLQWTNGDLADDGETLSLLDSRGQMVDTVTYDDEAPWPTGPDGEGYSLSLKNPADDNAAGANWDKSGPVGGTPGAVNFL